MADIGWFVRGTQVNGEVKKTVEGANSDRVLGWLLKRYPKMKKNEVGQDVPDTPDPLWSLQAAFDAWFSGMKSQIERDAADEAAEAARAAVPPIEVAKP